ncbi:MAG: DNA polymerase II [Candidatus Eisenbacteria bacterium]
MQRGFILDALYRVENGRPIVYLFGVGEQGGSFVVRDARVRPSFFFEMRDLDRVQRILQAGTSTGGFPRVLTGRWMTMRGAPAGEIEVAVPTDVPPLRTRLRQAGVACHEADLPFVTRYLIDRGLRGALRIEGRATRGERVARVYRDPTLYPDDWMPSFSVLSLDIETDPGALYIRSFALYGKFAHGGAVAEVHAVPLPSHEARPDSIESKEERAPCYYHRDERHLLRALLRRVADIDPDVLTGWNLIGFDLSVLERAFGRLGLPFRLGRANLPCRVQPASENWMTGRASVPGRAVTDGLDLVRGAFVRLDDYSLDTAARTILGEGKTLVDQDRGAGIERLYREDLPRFLAYNLTDARLVMEILDKLDLVTLAARRSLLTGLPIGRTGASIASFDFLYIAALHERGIVAPSVDAAPEALRAPPADPAEAFEEPVAIGGHVLDSVPGIHEQVWLFDYRSLYPSVILTFNIDPLGYLTVDQSAAGRVSRDFSPPEGLFPASGEGPIRAPNGAFFPRDEAILPGILRRLMPAREESRRRGDLVSATAIKILMNSFYGVLATPRCRFHDLNVSNAITTFGQRILLWTRDHLETLGHRVLYGDTDSVFVAAGLPDAREAQQRGEEVLALLNEALREWIREEYRVEVSLQLRFERHFIKFFIPSQRGAGEGSKKRHAGLVQTPAGPELVVTGLESVRRDWTVLAKDFQRHLLFLVLQGEPVEEFVRGTVQDLRAGRRDGDLIYRKSLRKALAAYDRTSPPHVKAARLMHGGHGRVIRYVMTTAGPQPIGFVTAGLDYEHYLEKQLRPIADSILIHAGTDMETILGRRQLGLF